MNNKQIKQIEKELWGCADYLSATTPADFLAAGWEVNTYV